MSSRRGRAQRREPPRSTAAISLGLVDGERGLHERRRPAAGSSASTVGGRGVVARPRRRVRAPRRACPRPPRDRRGRSGSTVSPRPAKRRTSVCTLVTSGQVASMTGSRAVGRGRAHRRGRPRARRKPSARRSGTSSTSSTKTAPRRSQIAHDVGVVHDLPADVDRRAVPFQRPLHDLDGPLHPGAERPRAGQQRPARGPVAAAHAASAGTHRRSAAQGAPHPADGAPGASSGASGGVDDRRVRTATGRRCGAPAQPGRLQCRPRAPRSPPARRRAPAVDQPRR